MENSVTLRAHAKLNWVLNVLYKRPDGYHELETVMQMVSLHDVVRVQRAQDVRVDCPGVDVPNIAERAARAYIAKAEAAGRKPVRGAHITIEKHIPQQAGLGGGSADAAAVLRGMNALYGALGEEALYGIAREIGADVSACLCGRPVLATGIGEKLQPFDAPRPLRILLAQPEGGISSAALFGALDVTAAPHHDCAAAVAALAAGDAAALGRAVGNALWPAAAGMNPALYELRGALAATDALGVSMTGSGSCCFALYADAESAQEAAKAVRAPFVWTGTTLNSAWE